MAGNPAVPPPQRVFLYHADANAIGGTVDGHDIRSRASVSLPLAGGSIEMHRKGRDWRSIVTYKSESTHASSRNDGTSWTTLVTATIEGLNILQVVTADLVVAQLEVTHPQNGGEPTISVLGSKFKNLCISDVEINPSIQYDLFSKHSGLAQNPPTQFPTNSWLNEKDFTDRVAAQKLAAEDKYNKLDASIQPHFHRYSNAKGQKNTSYLVCSLIPDLPELPQLGVSVCGNGIYIPKYGKFFFAELIVQEKTFTVSMVRAQLGSANVGALSAATVRSNGVPDGP